MNRPLNGKSLALLALALVTLVLLAGCNGNGHAEHGMEEHGPEDHTREDDVIRMSADEIDRHGIETAVAGPGPIAEDIELPGEVRLNEDRVARVSPRVPGVAVEIFKTPGDSVSAGEALAVIESAELAEAKAAYLDAVAELRLTRATVEREQTLHGKGVSSEQELLEARRRFEAAEAHERSAENRLMVLGLDREAIGDVLEQEGTELTRHTLVAPLGGRVVERKITTGESVEAGQPVFTVADLSTVWIDLSVYQRDLTHVRDGQTVLLETDHAGPAASATIDFVQPIVDDRERTAYARILMDNSTGEWHPGCFVQAHVAVGRQQVPVRVERGSVQSLDAGTSVVFVAMDEGFSPRRVETGRSDAAWVEIRSGLAAGDTYVSRNAFALKSDLLKDAFGGGHVH